MTKAIQSKISGIKNKKREKKIKRRKDKKSV